MRLYIFNEAQEEQEGNFIRRSFIIAMLSKLLPTRDPTNGSIPRKAFRNALAAGNRLLQQHQLGMLRSRFRR